MKLSSLGLVNVWIGFKEVLEKYPEIFEEKFIDIGLFMNIYASVGSRCFTY